MKKSGARDKKPTGLIHTEYPSALRFNVDLVVLDPKNITDYKLKRQTVMCASKSDFGGLLHTSIPGGKKS